MQKKPSEIYKAMAVVADPKALFKQDVFFIHWNYGEYDESFGPYISWEVAARRLSDFTKSPIETEADLDEFGIKNKYGSEGPLILIREVEVLPDGRVILEDKVLACIIDEDNLCEYDGPGEGWRTKDQIDPLYSATRPSR